jgi:hypothetical protein
MTRMVAAVRPIWAAMVLFGFCLGCGARKNEPLTPNAMVFAFKMKEAIKSMNTSELAGQIAAAENAYTAMKITSTDLNTLRRVNDHAGVNEWNDARNLLDEVMGHPVEKKDAKDEPKKEASKEEPKKGSEKAPEKKK